MDPANEQDHRRGSCIINERPLIPTPQDVVEIQCHGGIVPVRQILKLLVNHDVRMAEAGEFTKRAFMNGRIDPHSKQRRSLILLKRKQRDSLSSLYRSSMGLFRPL